MSDDTNKNNPAGLIKSEVKADGLPLRSFEAVMQDYEHLKENDDALSDTDDGVSPAPNYTIHSHTEMLDKQSKRLRKLSDQAAIKAYQLLNDSGQIALLEEKTGFQLTQEHVQDYAAKLNDLREQKENFRIVGYRRFIKGPKLSVDDIALFPKAEQEPEDVTALKQVMTTFVHSTLRDVLQNIQSVQDMHLS